MTVAEMRQTAVAAHGRLKLMQAKIDGARDPAERAAIERHLEEPMADAERAYDDAIAAIDRLLVGARA